MSRVSTGSRTKRTFTIAAVVAASTLGVWTACGPRTTTPPPGTPPGTPPDPQALDARLAEETARLLLTYGAFKQYPEKTPAEIEARLGADRAAVFHAVVRATFVPLTPKPGKTLPPNARPIDFLEAVHGIWGVRPNDMQGKHQFRVSVKLRPGVRKVLKDSVELGHGTMGHVLTAVVKGGDDDPAFQDFQVESSFLKVDTHRANFSPSLQISYLQADNTIGEIDVDFDTGPCHLKPANSDVRSVKDANHRHLQDFNARFNFFTQPLSAICELARFHCGDTHGDANCP